MNIRKKIDNMSDEEVKQVWDSLKNMYWCGSDMYDDKITMDEWGMMIYDEMDCRGLDKGL